LVALRWHHRHVCDAPILPDQRDLATAALPNKSPRRSGGLVLCE
jgi:hypothetical protein